MTDFISTLYNMCRASEHIVLLNHSNIIRLRSCIWVGTSPFENSTMLAGCVIIAVIHIIRVRRSGVVRPFV